MNVPARDEPRARVTSDYFGQLICVEQILLIHVPDTTLEWRVMQEEQCRPICCRRQRRVEPLQRGRL